MTSVNPSQKTHTFDGDGAAVDLVDASQLDTQLSRAFQQGNSIIASLNRITDATDQLGPKTVGLRQLKAEVVNAMEGLPVPLESVATVATTNVTLSGLQTLNGHTLTASQRVLLVGQTDKTENGIWVAASGAWARPSDFTAGSAVDGLTNVSVALGNLQGAGYLLQTDATVDTSDQTWVLFQAAYPIGLANGGHVILLGRYASLADAVADIGSEPVTLVLDVPSTLTGNLVIPSTLQLLPTPNGLINGSTYTLTINSTDCGWPRRQLWSFTSGSVAGSFSERPLAVWWGVVGDGSTDDTDAFQQALDYCETQTVPLTFFGNVKITDTVTVYSNSGLIGAGGFKSKITATQSDVALEITGDDIPPYAQAATIIGGFELSGPSRASGSVGLSIAKSPYTSAGEDGPAHVTFQNIYVHGFETNIYLGQQSNLNGFRSIRSADGKYALFVDNSVTISEERLAFYDCVFFNSEYGVYCEQALNLFFSQCSFDYCTERLAFIQYATCSFHQCHFETSYLANKYWVEVPAGSAAISFRDCLFSPSVAQNEAMFYHYSEGVMLFSGCRFNLLAYGAAKSATTVETIDTLVKAPAGKVEFEYTQFANYNGPYPAGCTDTCMNSDYSFETGVTGWPTRVQTGTGVAPAQSAAEAHTGTNSVVFEVGAGAGTSKLGLDVFITKRARLNLSCWIKWPLAAAGKAEYLQFKFAYKNSGGTVIREDNFAQTVHNAGSWFNRNMGGTQLAFEPPAGAVSCTVEITLVYVSAATTCYLDDVVLSSM